MAINCKVLQGDNARLVTADPSRFYMPAYVGSRGWVGLMLDCGETGKKSANCLGAVILN